MDFILYLIIWFTLIIIYTFIFLYQAFLIVKFKKTIIKNSNIPETDPVYINLHLTLFIIILLIFSVIITGVIKWFIIFSVVTAILLTRYTPKKYIQNLTIPSPWSGPSSVPVLPFYKIVWKEKNNFFAKFNIIVIWVGSILLILSSLLDIFF